MVSDAGHCLPGSVRLLQAVCITSAMSHGDMQLVFAGVRDSQVEGDPEWPGCSPSQDAKSSKSLWDISASVHICSIAASLQWERRTFPGLQLQFAASQLVSGEFKWFNMIQCNQVAIMKRPDIGTGDIHRCYKHSWWAEWRQVKAKREGHTYSSPSIVTYFLWFIVPSTLGMTCHKKCPKMQLIPGPWYELLLKSFNSQFKPRKYGVPSQPLMPSYMPMILSH